MTNSSLFRDKAKECAISIKALAEKIGLTRQGLTLKIDNVNEFKSGEISEICKIFNLSIKEKEAIFFANQVDK